MKEEEMSGYDRWIKPAEERYKLSLEKAKSFQIGDAIKYPWFAIEYNPIQQYKFGTIIDRVDETTFLVKDDNSDKKTELSVGMIIKI